MVSSLRRPSRYVPILVALILAAAGAWLWRGASSSTLASADGAVADYRARMADAPPARDRPGVPAPGVYFYRQSGSEEAGGAITVSRALPARAVYIASPTAAGYHEDLRLSAEHVEEARFRVDRRGATAEWRRTKITFLGVGEDDRSQITPPSLDHPAELSPDARWGGTYRSGDVTVTYTGRVVGRDSMTLDGRTVPAVVLRTDSSFAGRITGTRRDLVSFAPSLSLPVRWTIAQETGGDADYSMDATLELESAVPVT